MKHQKTLLSAVQPSHHLTLGNYLGALKNWVQLQQDYQCLFFIVDLHAYTTRPEPQAIKARAYQALATYLAVGIDPEKAILFIQSHVSEHTELAWILNCLCTMGELSRMTQYKHKKNQQGLNTSVGLFTYPLLMAADILLYQTHLVPIGADQKQHLELARNLAQRFNHSYHQNLFIIPEVYLPPAGARIMSLQNPKIKMSKSDPHSDGCIYLTDTNDQIIKKLNRAVTDSQNTIQYSDEQPGVRNLLEIQCALLNQSPEQRVQAYEGNQYGALKKQTAELIIEVCTPIRKKISQYTSDTHYLDQLLTTGASKAQRIAQHTLSQVYDIIGFLPGRYR